MDYEIPKFEINISKRKSIVAKQLQDLKKTQEREEDWNTLERLSQLMIPKTTSTTARVYKLNVPNTKFYYTVFLSENQP